MDLRLLEIDAFNRTLNSIALINLLEWDTILLKSSLIASESFSVTVPANN